jgi:hypothetical protein
MKGGTGPTIKKGASNQVVETPWEFIKAVEKRFGPIADPYPKDLILSHYTKNPVWFNRRPIRRNWQTGGETGLEEEYECNSTNCPATAHDHKVLL